MKWSEHKWKHTEKEMKESARKMLYISAIFILLGLLFLHVIIIYVLAATFTFGALLFLCGFLAQLTLASIHPDKFKESG